MNEVLDKDLLVDKKKLVKIFKTTDRTITNWQDEGMPVAVKASRGKSNSYYLPEVLDWYIKREMLRDRAKNEDNLDENNPLAAQFLKEKIETQRETTEAKRIENRRKRQELVSVERVKQQWYDILSTVKTRVLQTPKLICQALEGVESRRAAEEAITKIMNSTLVSLATEPTYEDDIEDILNNDEQAE